MTGMLCKSTVVFQEWHEVAWQNQREPGKLDFRVLKTLLAWDLDTPLLPYPCSDINRFYFMCMIGCQEVCVFAPCACSD